MIFRSGIKLIKHMVKRHISKDLSVTSEDSSQHITKGKQNLLTAISKKADMFSGKNPYFEWPHGRVGGKSYAFAVLKDEARGGEAFSISKIAQ
jgi:hypothetical protein